jgi:hypothetical protein
MTSLPVITSLSVTCSFVRLSVTLSVTWLTWLPMTSLPVAHLSQIMMAYRSSKESSTDQTPNMPRPPPPQGYTPKSSTVRFWVQGQNDFFGFLFLNRKFTKKYSKNEQLMNKTIKDLWKYSKNAKIKNQKNHFGLGPKISQSQRYFYKQIIKINKNNVFL